MKSFQRRFILRLLLVSVVFYGILYLIFTRYIIANLPLILMIGLLFAVNGLSFVVITNTREKKPGAFVYSFMGVSMGRLLISAAFVFIYALTHRQDAKTFALTFFMLYFLYTILEVRAIYSFFKS